MYSSLPIISVRYKSICMYYQSAVKPRGMSSSMRLHIQNLRQMAKYTGIVTSSSQKLIRKSVDKFLQLSKTKRVVNPITNKVQKFKLTFVTLTIANNETMLTASEAYQKLLKPWLRVMKEKYEVDLYLWKAELQARGQIHYHVTLNHWIHHSDVRNTWNNIQNRCGLLANFYKEYGHKNPNSTDIHSVYKIKNIHAYLTKYLSKSEADKGTTIGKIWDCSKRIKSFKYVTFEANDLNKEALRIGEVYKLINVKYYENCTIYNSGKIHVLTALTDEQRQVYKEAINLKI
jgi:hypothetical protein